MDRRRELKRQYVENKPEMGIYGLMQGDTMYLSGSKDLRGALNRLQFDLKLGNFRNGQAQKEYNESKGAGFTLEIVEVLPYDSEDNGKDYREDLYVLLDMVVDNLRKQGKIVYTF